MSDIPSTSPAYRLALAICLIAGSLWAAGTIGFEITMATGGTLTVLSRATLIAWAGLVLGTLLVWRLVPHGTEPRADDPADPLILGLLLLLGAALPVILFRPDDDDSYYLANVIFALTNPDVPITDQIRGLAAEPLAPFRSAHWAVSTAFDYIPAALADWTGRPALDMRYFWLPACGGAVLVAGCFLLMRELIPRETDALLATFALITLYVIWRETHRDPGNFAFLRMFQAKAVVMTAILPAFAALLFRFLRAPSLLTAVALALLATGAAGMSTTSVFLIGTAAAGVTLGAIAAAPRQAGPIILRAMIAGVLCAALLIPLVRALTETLPLGADSPANRGWPTGFFGHVRLLGISSWALLVLMSAIVLFGSRGPVRNFVLGWLAAVVILFANPVSGQLLIDHVVGPNAYWRIFYALPWVALFGLSVVILRDQLPARLGRYAGAVTGLILVTAMGATLVKTEQTYGMEAIWPPAWKLVPETRETAMNVVAAAPDGTMIAPLALSRYIPLLSGSHPQLRLRTSGIEVWTLAAGHPDLATRRILATTALSGVERPGMDTREARYLTSRLDSLPSPGDALRDVISESQPATVVLRQDTPRSAEVIARLTDLDYIKHAETDGYEIWVAPAR